MRRIDFKSLAKKLALLLSFCLILRLLTAFGAGDALDSMLQELGENPNMAGLILKSQLGPGPATAPAAETAEPSDSYPSEGGAPSESTTQQSTPSPGVTATVTQKELSAPPSPVPTDDSRTPAVTLDNDTDIEIDVEAFLAEPSGIVLGADTPQVLIIHTHSSEAYSPENGDYVPSDPYRTEDNAHNVVRVGDVLADKLTELGVNVIHDRELYDYPSYSGSYSRSLEAMENYLEEYPDLRIIIDLHRDAIENADGTAYRTEYINGNFVSSQVMLLVTTGAAGLYHPNWRENMKLALRMQYAMEQQYPGFARPLVVSAERYNQHVAPGCILLEVGTNGNTLEEAERAALLFAEVSAPVILGLVDGD